MSRLTVAICGAVWSASVAACCFPDDQPETVDQAGAKAAQQVPAPIKTPPVDPAPVPPPAPAGTTDRPKQEVELVTAAELLKVYRAGRAAADARYKGKVVEFVGVVHSTGAHIADGPFVVFTAAPKGFMASAWFDPKTDKEIKSIQKGTTLRVRGTVDRGVVDKKDGDVWFQLLDCVIVDRQDPEPPKDQTPARKAAYVRIVAAREQAEAAAVKRFGRKPKADDTAGFTIPYRAFLERETERALNALATDLGMQRSELDSILKEGDSRGWPKK